MKATLPLITLLALLPSAIGQALRPPNWFDRFNGPSNGYDSAGSVATDHEGGVYVAGTFPHPSSTLTFGVLKYAPNGSRQWLARHTVSGGKALEVAVDAQKSVFASGYRWASPNYEEALVKFDANGIEQWSVRLDGRPVRLLPDNLGNVFVFANAGDGYDYDWLISKFDPNGQVLWESRFDSAKNLDDVIANAVFDRWGNVVVAGTCGTDQGIAPGDIVVAKYTPTGALSWRRMLSQGPTTHDFASDVGVDRHGNVLIMAATAPNASVYTLANELWIRIDPLGQVSGSFVGGQTANVDFGCCVVDPDGNMFALTMEALSRFGQSGQLMWRTPITNPTLGITLPFVQLDKSGNPLVAGTSFDGTHNEDILALGFTRGGALLWRARFNGPANGDDTMNGMCLDRGGNLFVSGTSWGGYSSIGGTADDIVIMRFDGSRLLPTVPAGTP